MDFLIFAYLGTILSNICGQVPTISMLQFSQVSPLNLSCSASSFISCSVTGVLFSMHQNTTLMKSRQWSFRVAMAREDLQCLKAYYMASRPAQKQYSIGLLRVSPLRRDRDYFQKEAYFYQNFLFSTYLDCQVYSLGFCLRKYLSFSLSFLNNLYSIVFNFPNELTCSQTSWVSQLAGMGTVSCRQRSETNQQNFLGFSTTKQTTLPYSSWKMDDFDTYLKTSNK